MTLSPPTVYVDDDGVAHGMSHSTASLAFCGHPRSIEHDVFYRERTRSGQWVAARAVTCIACAAQERFYEIR